MAGVIADYLHYLAAMISAVSSTIFLFFFQAEDGIRDLTVTGVQTCALPISLHALAQRLGGRAEEQTRVRLQTLPKEQQPQRAPTALAVLQIDAWLVRHRGPGWGKEKTQKPRVEWHEMKMGVFYRHEQRSIAAR